MTTIRIDYQAEARAAMELAAVATSEAERLKWVRAAMAWQDLAGEWPDHQCQRLRFGRSLTKGVQMLCGGILAVALAVILSMTIVKPSLASGEYVGQAAVTDGDTIEIHARRIRLWGIDAIEGAQQCWDRDGRPHQCGQYAAFALSQIIGRNVVTYYRISIDRYKRPVARCFVDGTDIGEPMVRAGWGIDFVQHSKGYYSRAQNEARVYSRGNWNFNWQHPQNYRSCIHTRGGKWRYALNNFVEEIMARTKAPLGESVP